MHLIEATLLMLLFATITVPWAKRTGIPIEILLVIGSLVMSLIPGVPTVILDPTVVFTLFLPPILFAAAYFTSWRDFKANRRPIFLLAFGLVLFTTVAVAAALRALDIGVSWPVAFLLGAIVSPPDASAATAIIGKLGVPRRLVTIIEGESLVNDATALVAYRFALAAIILGSFSFTDAVVRFLLVAGGGAIVGFIVARAGIFVLRRLNNTAAETTLTLITSFAAYIIAEHVGFSGVISTVVGGLYYGRKVPVVTSAQTHIEAEASWNTVLFIINGLVFTLIGLQMPAVMQGLGPQYSTAQLAFYAATILLVVIAVRFIWVFPASYLPRKLFPPIARKDPMPPWGVVTVLGWTGMRGIVSLAAALAIPLSLPSGEPFPFRNLLIFLTYVVILGTLVVPAITLPSMMRWLGIKDGGENQRDETSARLALARAVLHEIDQLKEAKIFPDDLLESTASRHQRRAETVQTNLEAAFSPLFNEDQVLRQLTRRLLAAERAQLENLRQQATIHDHVFFMLSRELDIEETRLEGQRI